MTTTASTTAPATGHVASTKVAVSPLGSTPYTPPQLRIATTAIDLFAEYGVGATTLQMIADRIGVTKAAVYHQFKTKEGIVIAAMEVELGKLEAALADAEAEPGPRARETLLRQVIDLSVVRRRIVSTLQHDPVIVRLLADHAPFQVFVTRLFGALLGDETNASARLRVAMVASAIGAVVTHPLVADLDDATLREGIFDLSREFLRLGA
jgi:AcrR family transcriptional regulator